MDVVDLILKIKQFGMENIFKKYYSTYTAQVVDNNDPEDRGRVRVSLPDILDGKVLTEWVEPQLLTGGKDPNVTGTKTDGSFGVFYPPKVGDYIWVEFRMGELRHPVYKSGGWWAEGEKPSDLDTDRKNAIFISRFGHKIIMDETEDAAKFTVEMESGSIIEIDDTVDLNRILISTNKGTLLSLDDTTDAENVTITDANGDLWKWDIPNAKWTIDFKGELEQTIEGIVNQKFQDAWSVEVAANGDITIGGDTVFQSGGNASFWGAALTNLGAESGGQSVPLGELLLSAVNLNVTLHNVHQHPNGLPLVGLPTIKENNIPPSVLSQKVKLV